jgi:hypothetical protein
VFAYKTGLPLIPFRHRVGGNPEELSRYDINMAIDDSYD